MSSFEGKVAVITGAGSGIGRALALNLSEKRAKLALSDVDTDGLAKTVRLAQALGAQVKSDRLDVAEREAVLAHADAVVAHFGTVHQVYNNAGIAYNGNVDKSEFKDIERIIDVDFWGVVNGTKAFLPHVIASGDGHIVNISSLFGLIAVPGQSAYNAAKFAVRGFTEALRQEMLVARHPVKVTCVHPGGIKTAVARNATVADGEDQQTFAEFFDRRLALHSPEMAAKTIVNGVAKGQARVVVGLEAKAVDVLARIMGSSYQRLVAAGNLDGPGPGEVLVKYTAAGLCHSDLHLTDGDLPPRFPIVGGHEGSGVIEEVGAGVTRVKPGDHVVCSFIPNCGTCRYCCTGRQNLCDMGATILEGCMPDGSFRFHSQGTDFGAMCMLGTFAERATVSQHSVVKVDDWLPLETAVLVGCGVPSGWGTAVNAGNLRAGDTAVIYGVGGLGINAVQGATAAGCKYVVVVDPVAFKRETALKFGATHAFADAASAAAKVDELTWGQGADAALILVGTVDDEVVSAATAVIGKGGTVVITGLADPAKLTVHVSGTDLTLHEKTIKGSLFGSCNPQYDIVRLLRLYDAGQLMLDELVTTTYNLEQVNQGYQDLRDGKNIRGVIVH